jgi:hypothetical protein
MGKYYISLEPSSHSSDGCSTCLSVNGAAQTANATLAQNVGEPARELGKLASGHRDLVARIGVAKHHSSNQIPMDTVNRFKQIRSKDPT